MGFIYRPFGIILGLLGGQLGKKIFNVVWAKIDEQDPPKATTQEAGWPRLITVAAIQGVIFQVTRVIVNRNGAQAWAHLTGSWPGEKRPDPK